MRFLSSAALWWLLLAAVIIALYLLKLRRRKHVVSSVLLWQRALEELEANAPFRRLRRSLLLMLQLAALLALGFALARPLVTTRALVTGSTVIVIDSTASMSSRDEGGGSRLDRAKQLARQVVDGLGGGDRAAVVESSSRVTVRSPLTSDKSQLLAAIESVRETHASGEIGDALLLAEQLARTEVDASIVVIGDGGGAGRNRNSPPDGLAITDADTHAQVKFFRVGRRADNVGVTAMSARQAGNGRQELFASIACFSPADRTVPAELRVDGRLIDARSVHLPAGKRASVVFDSLPESGGLAELKLSIEDDLEADNVGYAYVPSVGRRRAGVIARNPFLLQALAVNGEIDARRIEGGVSPGRFDCFIVEGQVPEAVLGPHTSIIAINPDDVPGLWRVVGQTEKPEISSVERAHPVNSYLSYADLNIEAARTREVAGWLKPVATAGEHALIWAGDDGQRRVVLIGFDLARTDLPLKIEFPILLSNAIAWITGRDELGSQKAVQTGQPVTLQTADASIDFELPSGETRTVSAEDGTATLAETFTAGIYHGADTSFAASLLSDEESDTAPRDSIATRAGTITDKSDSTPSESEIWRWIALIALTVLATEWWVYHKRLAS